MMPNVLVLISTYNGEKYLEPLLESVLNQKNVNVNILVRDDGSCDNTVQTLKKYQETGKIEYYIGNNMGYAYSFWHLLTNCKQYDYYAFCDQDDIWLEDKLIRAVTQIEKDTQKEEAILYTSNVICVNDNMEILNNHAFPCNRVLSVWESLQKSVLPGCTFVFNSYAQEILKRYKGYMESHDWAAYAIITTFGKVIYDNESYIYYRIHENNTIGVTNKVEELKKKVKRFFKKSKNARSLFAKDFYECYNEQIDIKYKNSIKNLGYYRQNFLCKIKLLFDRKFKGIIFKLYVIFSKV